MDRKHVPSGCSDAVLDEMLLVLEGREDAAAGKARIVAAGFPADAVEREWDRLAREIVEAARREAAGTAG